MAYAPTTLTSVVAGMTRRPPQERETPLAVILVTGTPGGGKTTATVAIALASFNAGLRTGVVRLGGTDGATADAAFYAEQPYAAPPSGAPIAEADIAERASRYGQGLLLVEVDSPADAGRIAAASGARVVAVGYGADAAAHLIAPVQAAGAALAGVVATAVPHNEVEGVRAQLDEAGWPVLAVIVEDRALHAPSIEDVARVTSASVLLGEARSDIVAEHIVVAPVSADPAYLHFRRYPNKLVIARSDKTELTISAVTTSTNAVLLTGGVTPSGYTFDRLSNERIPLLLAPGETVEVIEQLDGAFENARFGSARKVERLDELTRGQVALAALGLSQPAGA